MILRINDRIRNRRIEKFNDIDVTIAFDAMASQFAFQFYYDPNDDELKDLACIGHYHEASVEFQNQTLLTGFILNEKFKSASKQTMITMSGYGKSGVLGDCQISPEQYPLQNDGLTLRQIANKLIQPFGLPITVDNSISSEMDKVYDKATASNTETVGTYLAKLASQRNIVLTGSANGGVHFTRARTTLKPIASLDSNSIGVVSMELEFKGQSMHSDITVMKQADESGGNSGETTISNPFVPYVNRPSVKIQTSGDDNDTSQAAQTALSQELKGLPLTIQMSSWTINDQIILPNNIIEVENPWIYLFKKEKFFIEKVQFKGTPQKQTAMLTCFLPEVYNGQTPSYIFEGINLH